MDINELLKQAIDQGASDVHLKVGTFPVVRVNGTLRALNEDVRLDHEALVTMAATIMSANQRQRFKDSQELDLAYSVPGLGRFRCNVFQQRGTIGVVLRVIPMGVRAVRRTGPAARPSDDRRPAARPGPGHWHDRQRQEHDPRGDGGPHQPDARHPHHHDRRPDRVSASGQQVDSEPARNRQSTHGRSRTPCAVPSVRIPM